MTDETRPAFNLLDEPWIPVRLPGGEVRDVSLTQALLEADQIAALAETSPPNLIALYRMLLAVPAPGAHHPSRTLEGRRPCPLVPRRPARGADPRLSGAVAGAVLAVPSGASVHAGRGIGDGPETSDKLKSWTQVCPGRCQRQCHRGVRSRRGRCSRRAIAPALACRTSTRFSPVHPGRVPVKTIRDSDKAGPLANTAAVVPIRPNPC